MPTLLGANRMLWAALAARPPAMGMTLNPDPTPGGHLQGPPHPMAPQGSGLRWMRRGPAPEPVKKLQRLRPLPGLRVQKRTQNHRPLTDWNLL